MYTVDINCDMGESYGAYKIGDDDIILDYITSANIACGFHAGDPSVMHKTVKNVIEKNVGIGAHVGLPDLVGFGRRNMDVSPQEAFDMVVYQIGALDGFVKAEGGKMRHVKPHGALYNMAAKNKELSEAIAEAVYKVNPQLILFGLSGSELVKAGERIGLTVANEVFADRTYKSDGSLTPRREKNALITEQDKASMQVIGMIKSGKVLSIEGRDIEIKADTICIHGDGAKALKFASKIREDLIVNNILINKI